MEGKQEEAQIDNAIQDPKTVYSKDRLELTTLGALAIQVNEDLELLKSLAE